MISNAMFKWGIILFLTSSMTASAALSDYFKIPQRPPLTKEEEWHQALVSQAIPSVMKILMSAGAYIFIKKIVEKMPAASCQAREFVKEACDFNSCPYPESIRVADQYVTLVDTIFLEEENQALRLLGITTNRSSLDKALEDNNAEEIAEITGIVDHELGHLKHKDSTRFLMATLGINLGFWLPWLYVQNSYMKEKFGSYNRFVKSLYVSAAALVGNITTFTLISWYKQKREREADEHVRNDKKVLQAMIAFFGRTHEKIREKIKEVFGERVLNFFDCHQRLYYLFDPSHPLYPDRVAHMEKKLKALEANSLVV